MYCYLPFCSYVFDPADEDSELREKLMKNRDVAKANLAKVFADALLLLFHV